MRQSQVAAWRRRQNHSGGSTEAARPGRQLRFERERAGERRAHRQRGGRRRVRRPRSVAHVGRGDTVRPSNELRRPARSRNVPSGGQEQTGVLSLLETRTRPSMVTGVDTPPSRGSGTDQSSAASSESRATRRRPVTVNTGAPLTEGARFVTPVDPGHAGGTETTGGALGACGPSMVRPVAASSSTSPEGPLS